MGLFFQPSQNGFTKYSYEMRVREEYGARVTNPALQWLPGGLPGEHEQEEVDYDG